MEDLFEIALKQMALTAGFLLIYRLWLLPRRQFVFNRFFMILGLISSVGIPFVTVKKIIWLPFMPAADAPAMKVVKGNLVQESASLESLFLMGFGLISGLMLLWLLLRFWKVFSLLRTSELLEATRPKVLLSDQAKAPFSFLQYIVFPKSMYKGPNYEVILAHEKVHLRQWHSLDVIAVQLLLVVAWWNPILWAYKKAIVENLEFLADEATVAQTQQIKDYQYILLNQSLPMAHLSLVQPFYQSFLKKRIMMLNNSQPKKNPWASALVLPLLVAFVFAFNTKTIAQIAPPPPPVMATPNKLIPPPPLPAKQRNVDFSETSLSVLIEPSSTNEELEKGYLGVFEVYGTVLNFKKIKRNAQGLITGIKASFKTNNGKSGTYAVNGTEPIAPFEFFIQMNDQDVIQEAGFRTAKEKQAHSDRVMVRAGRLNKDGVIVTLMSDLDEEDVIDSEEKISGLMEQVQKMKQQALEIKVMGKAVDAKTEKVLEKSIEATEKKVIKLTIDNLSYTDKDNNEFVFFSNDSLATGDYRMKKAAAFINGTSFSGDTIIVDYKNIKGLDFDLVLPDSIAGSLGGIKAGKNGVFVINSLGDTDASERKIVIKKKGSWKGTSNDPLIIIDGKEQPKDKRLNDINPDDIESVSVLKGAAALKKYGDKGSQGVIEIILKK